MSKPRVLILDSNESPGAFHQLSFSRHSSFEVQTACIDAYFELIVLESMMNVFKPRAVFIFLSNSDDVTAILALLTTAYSQTSVILSSIHAHWMEVVKEKHDAYVDQVTFETLLYPISRRDLRQFMWKHIDTDEN